MRKTMYVLALLAFATTLFAQEPFAGTWKLNTAKTKYTAGAPPKEATAVVAEQGANLQVTATGTYNDGSPLSVKYSVPIKGGVGTVQEGDFNGISAKVISAHVRENHYTKDGKELRTRRMVVSDDGKTMQTTVKGTDSKGKKVEGVEFADKQ